MKRLRKTGLSFLFAFFCCAGYAQTVSEVEWWFDSQYGSGVQRASVGSSNTTRTMNIATNTLDEGLHALHLRLKDNNGRYSGISSGYFFKFNRAAATANNTIEYWFDGDFDSRISGNIPAEGMVSFEWPTAGLDQGLHTVSYRTGYAPGVMGGISSAYFFKLNSGSAPGKRRLVYWFDDNTANSIYRTFDDSQTLASLDINAGQLTQGAHVLHMRLGYENGGYTASTTDFFVHGANPYGSGSASESLTVTDYTYWFDDAAENGVNVHFDTPEATKVLAADIPTASLTANEAHTFHIRFNRNDGKSVHLSEAFTTSDAFPGFTWSLSDGTLTISGTGPIPNFEREGTPWYTQRESITAVTINSGVTGIGAWAFYGCSNLTSVTIPAGVKNIGEAAFAYCLHLASVTIPNSVISIGKNAFVRCDALTTVTIPAGVMNIGENAFLHCSALTAVTIPNSVINIGAVAFGGCSALTSVTVEWQTPLSIPGDVFDGSNLPPRTLYVPAGTIVRYKATSVWKEFDRIEDSIGNTDAPIQKISLSQSILSEANSTLTITGQYFTPGTARLVFSKNAESFTTEVMVDANGEFRYLYDPLNFTLGAGMITVSALDGETGKSSMQRFIVEASVLAGVTISLRSPASGVALRTGRNIYIEWTDVMTATNGNYRYPMSSGTAKRMYAYTVEYQNVENGMWLPVGTVSGSAMLESLFTKTVTMTVSTPTDYFRVRVVDDYDQSNRVTSDVYKVETVVSKMVSTLEWDHSFPATTSYQNPKGVAADGVARVYVRVRNADSGSDVKIASANVSLSSDQSNTSAGFLGKLSPVVNAPKTYSTEANESLRTALSNITPLTEGEGKDELWFWYVAPDNFEEAANGPYAGKSERTVKISMGINLNDGSSVTEEIAVAIVRPPLMLVHGLGGNEHTWDNFKIDGSLFKWKNAVNLSPNAFYMSNAVNVMNTSPSNFLNSFQGNISRIRESGYAANQVDYVCHSMGGCILRTAMTAYKDLFYGSGYYGVGGSAETQYKSYGKGYVHKAITIDTPHNGSPVADAVTEFIPQASFWMNILLSDLYATCPNNIPFSPFNLWNYIQPVNPNSWIFTFEATGAVKNLQVMGTERFKLEGTSVRHHLIAGDIDLYTAETASFLASMDTYVDLLDKLFTIARDIMLPSPDKVLLNEAKGLNKVARVFTFIEWYSAQKGFPNFLGDGDMVVPLASQLARMDVPGSFPVNTKVFGSTSSLNANHLFITDRQDVGDYVRNLLNTSVGSNAFDDYIAGNPVRQSAPLLRSLRAAPEVLPTETHFDQSHIEIIAPARHETVRANDDMEIVIRLKDATRLAYINYKFQNNYDLIADDSEYQKIHVNVSPDFQGKQTVYVTAVYDEENRTVSYVDTVTVNVVTDENLLDFRINPLVAHVYEGERYYPEMTAIYETFLSRVPANSEKLSVRIDDPTVVGYDEAQKCFTGLKEASTFAEIRYEGIRDTLYFNVMSSSVIPVESVSLDQSQITLQPGETAQLTATVLPDEAADKDVTWSSSDPAVATVENGLVKGIAPGTTVITVTTDNGGKTASCDVTVVPTPTPTVSPPTLDFAAAGGTETVAVTSNVAWTASADAAWLTLTPASGAGDGTITVTATENSGSARTATITVTGSGSGLTQTVTVTQADGPNGNVTVETPEEARYYGGVLTVHTPVSETVAVYALNGVPIFLSEKISGEAVFRLQDLSEGVYIVRGSSGWARKIVVSD